MACNIHLFKTFWNKSFRKELSEKVLRLLHKSLTISSRSKGGRFAIGTGAKGEKVFTLSFNLYQLFCDKSWHALLIFHLEKPCVREGFFEHDEFIALRDALPSYLKAFVTFGYHTGWRIEEIRNLTWDCVDFNEGVVWVWASKTKNKKGKQFYLNGELKKELQTLYREKACPFIFHREGKQIKDFRFAWKKACMVAGFFKVNRKDDRGKEINVHTKIFHDFRRTAVRNMTREGIPESVAMKISGHKTASVFKRYDIVASQDLKDASKRIEAYHIKQETKGKRAIPFPVKSAQNE